jgi:hypothetical protein
MVWVRMPARSSRRLVNRCSTIAWFSTPTCRSCGALRAATATEAASSGSLLRPWPTDSTRTPGGQLGRHVHDLLPVADQPLGQRPADAVGAFDRPTSLLPLSGPLAQRPIPHQGGRNTLAIEQLAVPIERGRGVGGLVWVDPDGHRHGGTFLEGGQGATGEGRPTLSRSNPLWSHSRSGAGRTAQPFLSQPETSGSGGCGATCRHPGTLWAAGPDGGDGCARDPVRLSPARRLIGLSGSAILACLPLASVRLLVSNAKLALLGQRRGQCSALFYLALP